MSKLHYEVGKCTRSYAKIGEISDGQLSNPSSLKTDSIIR